MNRPARVGERGLSLVEATIMGLIMSALMVMVTESVASLSSTRSEHRVHANIGNIADRTARLLESDIAFASRVFTDSEADLEYFQSLAIGPAMLASGARLPRATARGYFELDPPGEPETGNVACLGVRGERLRIYPSAVEPDSYLVQTFSFVVYGTLRDAGGNLDLRRWASARLAAYWDVMQIADPGKRAAVLARLHEAGIGHAWDPGAPRATGLFQILQAGGIQPLPPGTFLVGADDDDGGRPFGRRSMRLAENGGLPGMPVPEFATPSGSFPGGFEVKVDGTSNGRLVLFRIVVESLTEGRRKVASEVRRMINSSG